MKLQVNGAPIDTDVTSLAQLLEAQGFGDAKVATAVNGTFVAASMRVGHTLNDGDAVEILAPMQGG